MSTGSVGADIAAPEVFDNSSLDYARHTSAGPPSVESSSMDVASTGTLPAAYSESDPSPFGISEGTDGTHETFTQDNSSSLHSSLQQYGPPPLPSSLARAKYHTPRINNFASDVIVPVATGALQPYDQLHPSVNDQLYPTVHHEASPAFITLDPSNDHQPPQPAGTGKVHGNNLLTYYCDVPGCAHKVKRKADIYDHQIREHDLVKPKDDTVINKQKRRKLQKLKASLKQETADLNTLKDRIRNAEQNLWALIGRNYQSHHGLNLINSSVEDPTEQDDTDGQIRALISGEKQAPKSKSEATSLFVARKLVALRQEAGANYTGTAVQLEAFYDSVQQ